MSNLTKEQTVEKITTVINQLKPYLQADGGDITLKEITDDLIVKVQLTGACGSCPYKIHTLKNGVEQALRREIPEIKDVVSID